MLNDLSRALAQLGDPVFVRILLIATVLTLGLFIGLGWGLDALFGGLDTSGWPNWAARAWGWIDQLAAVPFVILGLWLLFPAIATAIMSAFLDDIVDAVEARHYPQARAPEPMGLLRGVRLGLLSAARLIGWNLLALPLYLVLLFTAIGPFLLFLALNGYLLGRDLWQMVAIRHRGAAEAMFRRQNRADLFLTGVLVSLGFLLPILNLVAPLAGAALATHRVHRALGLSV